MATFGQRKSQTIGKGYEKDPIRDYAQSFSNSIKAALTESGYDYYREPSTSLMDRSVKTELKKFFVEGSYDPTNMTASEIDEHTNDMESLFENDIEGINEACSPTTFNAVVGLSLPMHKNIMMNMVFDKGAIPKEVAQSPKFTRTMERRLLVKPDGTEIDMFLEQNKLTDAIRSVNPWTPIDITLPELGTTNVVTTLHGADVVDHVDVNTYISAIKVTGVCFKVGDVLPDATTGIVENNGTKATVEEIKDAWYRVKLEFHPGYGTLKRQLMSPVSITVTKRTGASEPYTYTPTVISDIITGSLEKDKFVISSIKGNIPAVRLSAKLDASNRTIDTCTVKWDETTTLVEIGTDEGVNTTISPEEVKDINSLYNVNQLTKVMSLMKTVLANRKDDIIKEELELSFKMLDSASGFHGTFDYAPREGYMGDHVTWRRQTFFEYFDAQVTTMLQVLNDPNMSVSVFGTPDLIRRITPTEYTYQAPAAIGAVDIDFTKTVVTSDKRVYQFVGSDKLRGVNQLILLLCPRNTNRVVYVIYDYQMYISNEIRQNNNPALPNICAFERWKFDSYQPVQGRIDIVNPTGLRDEETATRAF
jgi:hypothetical protein